MPKLTSADCVKAVAEAFKNTYPDFSKYHTNPITCWKRLSKTKEQDTIVRVFSSKSFPVLATVTEVDGIAQNIHFRILHSFDIDGYQEEFSDDILEDEAYIIASQQSQKPEDFLFYVWIRCCWFFKYSYNLVGCFKMRNPG